MLDVISTAEAPRSIGHYSQAISANGFIFVSGQVAIDPATHQVIAGNAATQTERIMKNLCAILRHSGSCLERVVRSTVFLKDMDDFAATDDVCAKYFGATAPARSTVEVARLPKDVLVEIDVIAVAKVVRFFPDQDDFNAQVNGLVTLDLVRKDGSNLVLTERGKVALRT